MAPYKLRVIENSLKGKGFRLIQGGSHKKLTLFVDGKKTRVFTFLSHGAKNYDNKLLSKMKGHLHLGKEELCDLIECPISGEEYMNMLVDRGIVQRSAIAQETDV